MPHPHYITFEGQHEGEEVILWIERHWLKHFKLAVFFIFLTIIPGIIIFFLIGIFFAASVYRSMAMTFLWVYELYALLFLFIEWMNDELDLFIVTNERIIDIDQVGFLNRKISDGPLKSVQDVSVHTNGFLATIFNYGTITIQTEAENINFTMEMVPYPLKKRDVIIELIKKAQDGE